MRDPREPVLLGDLELRVGQLRGRIDVLQCFEATLRPPSRCARRRGRPGVRKRGEEEKVVGRIGINSTRAP